MKFIIITLWEWYKPSGFIPKNESRDRKLLNRIIYTLAMRLPDDIGFEIRHKMIDIRHTFFGRVFLWRNKRFITRQIPWKSGWE